MHRVHVQQMVYSCLLLSNISNQTAAATIRHRNRVSGEAAVFSAVSHEFLINFQSSLQMHLIKCIRCILKRTRTQNDNRLPSSLLDKHPVTTDPHPRIVNIIMLHLPLYKRRTLHSILPHDDVYPRKVKRR